MKKLLCIVGLVLPLAAQCGVSNNTLICAATGLQAINSLRQGDSVVCADNNLAQHTRPIKAIHEVTVDEYIEVTTENNTTICFSIDQYVFVPFKWISVKDLSLNDVLAKKDGSVVHIKDICHKQQPLTMAFIEVAEHANFFASHDGILIHNGAVGATVGVAVGAGATWVAFESTYWGIGAALTPFVGPYGVYMVRTGLKVLCKPVQVATTKAVGLACGIALGAATGPI